MFLRRGVRRSIARQHLWRRVCAAAPAADCPGDQPKHSDDSNKDVENDDDGGHVDLANTIRGALPTDSGDACSPQLCKNHEIMRRLLTLLSVAAAIALAAPAHGDPSPVPRRLRTPPWTPTSWPNSDKPAQLPGSGRRDRGRQDGVRFVDSGEQDTNIVNNLQLRNPGFAATAPRVHRDRGQFLLSALPDREGRPPNRTAPLSVGLVAAHAMHVDPGR